MFRSVSIAALLAAAGAHAQLDGTVISLEHSAIGYRTQSLENPVADLQERLTRGTAELSFDPRPGIGYLPSVLRELGVPLESQLLVYSKTSLQQGLIAPERPRALACVAPAAAPDRGASGGPAAPGGASSRRRGRRERSPR